MARKHPESIFSTQTWKGEDGNGGLRNLYGAFAHLLAISHLNRKEETETNQQRELRREAAYTNFSRLYAIGARIKNNEYVTEKERTVWLQVDYDVNREVLRSLLRAFDSTVLKQKIHPEILDDKQSSMVELFAYIEKNKRALKSWENFSKIEAQLKRMNIDFS